MAEVGARLLLTMTMPLRVIAPLVGFRDEFQLSRVFRQVAGHPPSTLGRPQRQYNNETAGIPGGLVLEVRSYLIATSLPAAAEA